MNKEIEKPDKAEIVAKVYRGDGVEAIHYGSIAVVNSEGDLTHYLGDPQFFTFARSSPKPFQLLPTVTSGAADHFGFTPKQLAIMCGSHVGSDEHRDVVISNLEAAGNSPEHLKCGCHWPLGMMMRNEFPTKDEHLDFLRHNCSGKHSGFLALSKFLGEDPAEYINPNGKVQQMVLDAVAGMYEYPKDKIVLGTDGCSAPNFGLPMIHTAIAFRKLASAVGKDETETKALERIRDAMMAYPVMFSGEGRFDLALMKSFPNNVVCKIGAESIQGMGFRDPAIGIVIKIHDGNQRALYPVIVELLKQLGLIEDIEKAEHLKDYYQAEIRNNMNLLTGSVKAEFSLKKV